MSAANRGGDLVPSLEGPSKDVDRTPTTRAFDNGSDGDPKLGALRQQQPPPPPPPPPPDENEKEDDNQKQVPNDENDQEKDLEDNEEEENNNDQDDDQDDDQADDEDSDNKDDDSDSDGDDQEDGGDEDDEDDESDKDGSDGGQYQGAVNDENGLSAYERMRIERIKRNQEYLATLGLQGNIGKAPKKKKRNRTSVPAAPVLPRSSLSRRTKHQVSYVQKPLRAPNGTLPGSGSSNRETAVNKKKKDSSKTPRKASQRMDRGIYDEFKRIVSSRKQLFRQAKRNVRTAEKEEKHWARQARNFQRKDGQRKEIEGMLQANAKQRQALGCTSLQLLEEIDQRHTELLSFVIKYDNNIKNQERQAQKQAQQLELERKMQIIDALDRFPKAIKEAFGTLNSMLLERTPRNPPPPRRSKRKSDVDAESATQSPVDKKVKGNEHESLDKGQRWRELAKSFGPEAATPSTPQHATADEASKSSTAKPKKKKDLTGRSVGGWISPRFAAEVDRSWLEREKPTATFDLSKYVPQVGDTVLYYPSAHHAFLESNPDTLGVKLRNLLRVPLWQRAKRERAKSKRAQEEGEKVPTGTQKTWWTDDWLEGITSDLGNYPIICRVERTHAEFPPDPYSALKQIEKEGGEVKVTWTLPTMAATGGGKKIKNKTHMRLAVVLRALTPVVPPAWTGDVPVEEDSLGLPPNFTVVTAPASAAPFLIPFAWGYCITHSLSSGDQVAPISKADNKKGKICDFNSIGDEYGSFRLDDKMQIIRHVLGQLKNGSQLSVEAVEETVFAGLRSQSNLEFSDACAVVEILSGFMEGRASTSTDDAPSGQVNLLTLVRCTLPVLNGICVNDVYNRKKHYHSPWHLSVGKYKKSQKHANVPIITDAQEGPPRAFDDAMRFKIECTIDDFIKNNSDAEIFIPPVTDEIAPDYSCAVPISMCLQRVLSRLKVGKASSTGSRCYYTSIESVLFDLQAIADNCVLYNSPDSDVVEAALDLIPTAKKMISDVSNRHMKEQNARMKEEEGRRRLVLRQVDASALEQAVPNENNKSASTKRSKVSIIPGNLNAPCKAPLHKDWLQQIGPEGSWSLVPDETVDVSKWVPQSGDPIIYSRSLHTKFVKGHNSSMIEEQCVIPRFQLSEDYESPSEVATIAGNAEGQDGSINLNLLETIDTKWMKGTIAWARACFPRNPGKDVEETFAQNSPLLAIAIRFDYDWIKGGLFVVCWRPCMFCEDADAGQSVCETCGVSTETSFLRPGWAHINTEEIISSPLQPQTLSNASLGLPDIFRTSIGRCFDMLKRRCLNEIPTDYVDPNFCRENIKSGSNLALAKMGSRSLPSFQVSLEPKSIAISSSKTIATRGIRKTETEEPGNDLLSDVHYLPPWFPGPLLKAGTKKSAELPLYETMMPAPKISLELILLRVRSGYYRQLAALHNDIIEAYVASVLFVLSKPALRKKEPLSMRKIVRFMASPKGNSGAVSYSKTSKKKTPKANESTSAEAEEQLSEKQVSKSTSSLFSLNEEESQLVARIDKVRRLYATALVCVSETSHVERIFGIVSPTEKRSHVEETLHVDEELISAVIKVKYLLAAVGRDPCRNIFGGFHGHKKLKITCEGQVVQGEKLIQQKVANPAALAEANLPSPPTQARVIVIPWKYCERNDELSQCLYGRPARMFPCVRCQVYCRSMHSCRVLKAHTNPDFDLIHNFAGVGGVNGLLRPFLSQARNAASLPTEALPSELVETSEEASAPSSANAQNDETASSMPAATDPPKTDEIALENPDLQADHQGASESVEDPAEFLQKSKTALKMAQRLLKHAEWIAKAPTRLGEEFIKSYFPVDPADGHYIYCIICGLSGDVICCEGCHNVVHTHCIGLPQIPEDDWFCSKCVAKKPHSRSTNPSAELPPVIGNSDENAPAQETEAQLAESNDDAIEIVSDTMTGDTPSATEVVAADAQKEPKAPTPEIAANPTVQLEIEADRKTSALPATRVSPPPGDSDNKAESEVVGEPQKSEKMIRSDAGPHVTSTVTAHQYQKPDSGRPAPMSDSHFEKEAAELAQYLEELHAERTKNDPPPVILELSKKALAAENSASISGRKADGASPESKRKENDPADQSEQREDDPARLVPIGTKFTKDFGSEGEFHGEVVSLPTDDRLFYGVRYEDGDAEDLYESELLDLLPLSESKKYVKTPVKKKQRYWSRRKKVPSEAPAESEAPYKKKQRYWSRRKKLPGDTRSNLEAPPKKKQRYWSRVKKVPSVAPAEGTAEAPIESETPPQKEKQRYWSRRKKTPTSAQPVAESSSDAMEAIREDERKRRSSFFASDDSNNSDDNDQLPGRRRSRRPPNRFSDQSLKLYAPRKRATSTPDRMGKSRAVDSVTRQKRGRSRSDEESSHEGMVREESRQKRTPKRSLNSPSKAEEEAEGQPQKRTRASPRKPAPEEEDDAPAAAVPRGRGRLRKSFVEDVEEVNVHRVASPREESSSRASRRRGRSVIADQEEEKHESGMDVLKEVHKLEEEEGALEHSRRGRTRRAKRHFDDE